MAKTLDFPTWLNERRTFSVFNDFINFATGTDGWTSLAADSGASVAHSDAANGILVLTTGATDENECSVKTTTEPFLIATDRPMIMEARIQFTEASTDQAAVAVGFANAFGAADFLVDGTGAVAASADSLLLLKSPGETAWRGFSSNGATRTSTLSQTTAGGSSYQVVRLEAIQVGSSIEVWFYVDGVQLVDTNNNPIKHSVLVASATEMNLGVYVKTAAAASQVVNVDYIGGAQLRNM